MQERVLFGEELSHEEEREHKRDDRTPGVHTLHGNLHLVNCNT
jgi:hypothetical protein